MAEEPSELGADAALRLRVEKAKHFADGDIDLTKQLIADIHSEQRQLEAQHFESRKEYARDVTESVNRRERFLFEYGIQTLKWLFLLNAGTAGALLAYVGAKSGIGSTQYLSLIKALWPFGGGAALIPIAGASSYFNFSYARLLLPSKEAIHSFFNTQVLQKWPQPEGMLPSETSEQFYARLFFKLRLTLYIAVGAATLSALFYLYGLWRIARVLG